MSTAADEALHYIDENTSGISPQRFNARGRTAGNAAYLLSLSPTFPGQSIRCIKTGSTSLQVDRSYSRDSTNTKWLAETGIRHYHDANTDTAGGFYRDVLGRNFSEYVLINPATMTTSQFYTEVANGAMWSNSTGGILLTTNSSAGAYGSLQTPGPIFSFMKWMLAGIRAQFSSGTRMTLKWGMRMEPVNVDPTGALRAGIEACDTAGIARNFNIITGDGNTWTSAPTLEPVATTDGRGYRLGLEPSAYAYFMVKNWDQDTEVFTLKTNNIPPIINADTGSTSAFRLGYRTNEAASKICNFYNMKAIGGAHPYYW